MSSQRQTWQVVGGVVFLTLAVLLLFRAWGIWFGDALVWPVLLAGGGAALIWRQSQGAEMVEPPPEARARPGGGAGRPRRQFRLARPSLSLVALGATLVIGAGFVFLWLNDALVAARDVVLAVGVVVVALGLILAPWWLRLVRGLDDEREERIRSQERAEMAAHLHDSVLQTLALMQKRADDPREVATLARRQERELRSWLNNGSARSSAVSFAAALEAAVAEIEDAHGVPVDVVAVGDRALDEKAEALVAATREAVLNAVKFAPGRRDQRLRRGRRATAWRSSCATAGRASSSAPCPPTGAGCASPCSAAWSATAAAPRSTRAPARAPRSSW